ncbi:heparanase-like protein 1, partial [Genlisea aurea]
MMSSEVWSRSRWTSLVVFLLLLFPVISVQNSEDATLTIDTTAAIAETDSSYICVTLDWWPPDKCNYNRCPWGSSSVLNLNLSHPLFAKAIQGFDSLRVRIGGSLQDGVVYNVGNVTWECGPFKKKFGGLFGYSTGCLSMERWDELLSFFKKTGVKLTFGLNALYGRQHHILRFWGGDWDPTNARDFVSYTLSKGYHVDSWEFGNELCGTGIGASVGAKQYGKDVIVLKNMVDDLEVRTNNKPPASIVAPGGFYASWWFDEFVQASGQNTVNAVSLHLYTLGSGNARNVKDKILSPRFLDKASSTLKDLNATIEQFGPWASIWVSESGGAFNNGAKDVSDTFLNSFWYLDQLALAATHNAKVYCRQSLVGGFYELLDQNTFVPNPDYYSALLWHKLMGERVLDVSSSGSMFLRAYAHCTKKRDGVTLLLINLSGQTTYDLDVETSDYLELKTGTKSGKHFADGLKKAVSWLGNRASDEDLTRE